MFSDVTLGPNFIKILLHYSNTDQLGKGRWIVIRYSPGTSVCAFSWLSKYLLSRPLVRNNCYFTDLIFLLHQFSAVLKKCFNHLGLGHLLVTSHSFRIGAATEAARLDLSEPDIKKLGVLKSDCFQSYIRPNVCFYSNFRFSTCYVDYWTFIHLLG